jgi:hypothetical protein
LRLPLSFVAKTSSRLSFKTLQMDLHFARFLVHLAAGNLHDPFCPRGRFVSV